MYTAGDRITMSSITDKYYNDAMNETTKETTMHSIAIDIETTATVQGAGIWQIGACTGSRTFIAHVKLHEDAVVDDDTMKWLYDNNLLPAYEKAQKEGEELLTALTRLSFFINTVTSKDALERDDNLITWGNFDDPLLVHWYKKLGLIVPWHYSSVLDMRAAMKFLQATGLPNHDELPYRPDTSKHNALLDALAVYDLFSDWKERVSFVI